MNRNMKVLLIGAALMLFVVGGTIWQVIEVNQSGRSPLTVLFEEDEQSATPEPTPVTIILREETPTPEPTPTPAPTPEPTPEATPAPTPEPTPDPAAATPTLRPEVV